MQQSIDLDAADFPFFMKASSCAVTEDEADVRATRNPEGRQDRTGWTPIPVKSSLEATFGTCEVPAF